MRFKIQMVMEDEQGLTTIKEVLSLEKSNSSEGVVGLSLLESKDILKNIQANIVIEQANSYTRQHKNCPYCDQTQASKGYHLIKYRTLFGVISIPSLRVHKCHCHQSQTATISVLNEWLPEHTSPELKYIETKWSALMSYGQTAKLLHDLLPISDTENATTIRRHLYAVAIRQEDELKDKPTYLAGAPMVWSNLPKPDKPLTVGIDGGYVRDWNNKKTNFEVITGKSLSKSKPPKRFGFVQAIDQNSRQRLLDFLTAQGMQANQQITFLSDGADNLRDLQYRMYPESEHVLDWFHITMRITVLNQFAKGLANSDPKESEEVQDSLDSSKWYLWHGNVEKALQKLEDCWYICYDDEIKYSNRKKFLKQLEEMSTYIENNQYLIPNYGEKWRYGETISTGFVESTVNEVIAKRMVKRQQMQWTPNGAHYLIQVRTVVLNNELRKNFERWYPGQRFGEQENHQKAA